MKLNRELVSITFRVEKDYTREFRRKVWKRTLRGLLKHLSNPKEIDKVKVFDTDETHDYFMGVYEVDKKNA